MSDNFDEVGCFLGPHPNALRVWLVDQVDADTGEFDEPKALIGFASRGEALDTYRRAFSDGKASLRIGRVREMSMAKFKRWLGYGE